MDVSGILLGTAGVYHVMSELTFHGYHAAATHGNAPNFDILVCTPKGEDVLAIQVKSSPYATRYRGKGNDKKPTFLDFPFSYHAGKIRSEKVLFAFVDFGVPENCKPDIYFIPSIETSNWCADWIDQFNGKMVRFKQPLEWMASYKNNWSSLDRYKDRTAAEAIACAPIQSDKDCSLTNSAASDQGLHSKTDPSS